MNNMVGHIEKNNNKNIEIFREIQETLGDHLTEKFEAKDPDSVLSLTVKVSIKNEATQEIVVEGDFSSLADLENVYQQKLQNIPEDRSYKTDSIFVEGFEKNGEEEMEGTAFFISKDLQY